MSGGERDQAADAAAAGPRLEREVAGRRLDDEVQQLARRWPRRLGESIDGLALAGRWVASREAARAAGLPGWARAPLSPALASALFEVRRARRVVRGLEPATTSLARAAAGRRHPAARGDSPEAGARIARLLLVSEDASQRLLRQVDRLHDLHRDALEVLVVAADESGLGGAVFGPGERARVVLIDHKDAVVRLLAVVDPIERGAIDRA